MILFPPRIGSLSSSQHHTTPKRSRRRRRGRKREEGKKKKKARRRTQPTEPPYRESEIRDQSSEDDDRIKSPPHNARNKSRFRATEEKKQRLFSPRRRRVACDRPRKPVEAGGEEGEETPVTLTHTHTSDRHQCLRRNPSPPRRIQDALRRPGATYRTEKGKVEGEKKPARWGAGGGGTGAESGLAIAVVVVGSLAKAKGPRKESSRFYYSQALTLQCDGTAQPQRVARRPRRRGDDRPFDDYPMTNWAIWVIRTGYH
jgi:hypothetical protein